MKLASNKITKKFMATEGFLISEIIPCPLTLVISIGSSLARVGITMISKDSVIIPTTRNGNKNPPN